VPGGLCRGARRLPVRKDHHFAGNDNFAHWKIAAEAAQYGALAKLTRAKRDSSWRRYVVSSDASVDSSTLFSDNSDDVKELKPSPVLPLPSKEEDWTPDELKHIALEP
jgi:hypothetical protein